MFGVAAEGLLFLGGGRLAVADFERGLVFWGRGRGTIASVTHLFNCACVAFERGQMSCVAQPQPSTATHPCPPPPPQKRTKHDPNTRSSAESFVFENLLKRNHVATSFVSNTPCFKVTTPPLG